MDKYTLPAGTDLNEIESPGVFCLEQVTKDALQMVARVVRAGTAAAYWAMENRPRLLHLALRAKKCKDRRKNLRRIIREYCKEVLE